MLIRQVGEICLLVVSTFHMSLRAFFFIRLHWQFNILPFEHAVINVRFAVIYKAKSLIHVCDDDIAFEVTGIDGVGVDVLFDVGMRACIVALPMPRPRYSLLPIIKCALGGGTV